MKHRHTHAHKTIEDTHAKILVSALEIQVSCGDTKYEVIDQ
jgi:hypothetical protein